MKRNLSLIVALMLTLALFVPAHADGTSEFYISEAGMTLVVPDDLVVFTYDHMLEEDLSAYGLTEDYMVNLFQNGSIYFNAWDVDVNFEVLATVVENTVQDFTIFTDDQMMQMGDIILSAYEGTGTTCSGIELYETNGLRYLKMDIVQRLNGSDVPGVQYYILNDYKAINIFLNSYSGEVTGEMEELIRSIIDRSYFGRAVPVPVDEPVEEPAEVPASSGGNSLNSIGGGSSSAAPAEAPASSGNSLNSIGGGSSSAAPAEAPASSGNSLNSIGGGSSSAAPADEAPASGAGRGDASGLVSPLLEGIWDGLGDAGSSGSSGSGIWGGLG